MHLVCSSPQLVYSIFLSLPLSPLSLPSLSHVLSPYLPLSPPPSLPPSSLTHFLPPSLPLSARYQVDVGGSPFTAVAYYHHAISLDPTKGDTHTHTLLSYIHLGQCVIEMSLISNGSEITSKSSVSCLR